MTTINVTAEHIAQGIARDRNCCPIALAISDALSVDASVTGQYVRLGLREYELPAEVNKFTWNFDYGQHVEPFSFELDYPAVSRDGTAAPRIEEQAVTLARETAAQRDQVGALAGVVAEWADDALAGGAPPKWVARQMITAGRLIAAAARGEAAAA